MAAKEAFLNKFTQAQISSAVLGDAIFINILNISRRLYFTSIVWGYQAGVPADLTNQPQGFMVIARSAQYESTRLYGNPNGITPKDDIYTIWYDTLAAFDSREILFERGNEPYLEAGETGLVLVTPPTPAGAAYNAATSTTLLVRTRYEELEQSAIPQEFPYVLR